MIDLSNLIEQWERRIRTLKEAKSAAEEVGDKKTALRLSYKLSTTRHMLTELNQELKRQNETNDNN